MESKNDLNSKLSELKKNSVSFLFRNSTEEKSIIKNSQKDGMNRIFEVFHKKEIVYPDNKFSKKNKNSEENRTLEYKCFYCKKSIKNINKYEFHIRNHVSYI